MRRLVPILWLVACTARPPSVSTSAARSEGDKHPRAAGESADVAASSARLWLRLTPELRHDLGHAFDRGPSRLEAELRTDGSLWASATGEPQRILLPPDVAAWPRADAGLGLYVQQPVELRLDSPSGPVVGTASRGAYLPVIRTGPSTTEVALPRHEMLLPSSTPAPVHVFVDSRALGLPAPPLPPETDREAEYADQRLELHVSPSGPPFSLTLCGALKVLERRAAALRVVQQRDGIEVMGWITEPPRARRGDNACPPRIVELGPVALDPDGPPGRAPQGYINWSPERDRAPSPLASAVTHGRSIYWLIESGDEPRCIEGRIKPLRAGQGKTLLQFGRGDGGSRRASSLGFEYLAATASDPDSIVLTGPTPQRSDGDGVALCGAAYMVVGGDGRHLELLLGDFTGRPFAYHPDDTEVWFLDASACHDAAAAANAQHSAMTPHFHRGC